MADDSSEIVKEAAESVAFENVKTNGGVSAFMTAMAYQQTLDASAGWRSINQALVGKITESIVMTSPSEGGADATALLSLAKMLQTTAPTVNVPPGGAT